MGKNDCTEHLLKNVCDNNVMEVLLGAKQLEIESLASTAINHLVDRPRGKSLTDVPGFNETLQSNGKHLQDLLVTLSDKTSGMKDGILSLKEENDLLKAKVKCVEESGIIKVAVRKYRGSMDMVESPIEWTEDFYVRPTDMVTTVLEKLEKRRGKPSILHRGQALCAKWVLFHAGYLLQDRSFEHQGIWTNCLLTAGKKLTKTTRLEHIRKPKLSTYFDHSWKVGLYQT